jgi:hypothetical protein
VQAQELWTEELQKEAVAFWDAFFKSRGDWNQPRLVSALESDEKTVFQWVNGKARMSIPKVNLLLRTVDARLSPDDSTRLVRLYLRAHGFSESSLLHLTRALINPNSPRSLDDVPAFWRPFLSDKLQVVVPRHPHKLGEIGGVLSGTDIQAVEDLRAFFPQYGLCHLPVTLVYEGRTDYAEAVITDQLKTHLILVGGSNINPITRRALERIDPVFHFEERKPKARSGRPWLVIRGATADEEWRSPMISKQKPEIAYDHGIIIRSANPFEPSKQLLFVGGIHGYATWGGLRALLSETFIHELLNSSGLALSPHDHFECIIKTTVGDLTPNETTVAAIRRLRR